MFKNSNPKILHTSKSAKTPTKQGRRKVWKSGGLLILGGENIPHLIEIGLTVPPSPHLWRPCQISLLFMTKNNWNSYKKNKQKQKKYFLTSTSSLNCTLRRLCSLNCSGSAFKSGVTKFAGNKPSPRWLLPFHQLASLSSRIITEK